MWTDAFPPKLVERFCYRFLLILIIRFHSISFDFIRFHSISFKPPRVCVHAATALLLINSCCRRLNSKSIGTQQSMGSSVPLPVGRFLVYE